MAQTRMVLLTLGTVTMLVLGVALVLQQSAAFTTVGILLVIASAIVFLVDVKDFLLVTDQKAGKQPVEPEGRK